MLDERQRSNTSVSVVDTTPMPPTKGITSELSRKEASSRRYSQFIPVIPRIRTDGRVLDHGSDRASPGFARFYADLTDK